MKWTKRLFFSEAVLQRCSQERCFENMQQIYSRTPMPKCDFKKIVKQRCSPVNVLHIFRTPFPKNTSVWRAASVFKKYHDNSVYFYCISNCGRYVAMFEICILHKESFQLQSPFRSSHPEVSCKKRCSQKFCKIHRKTPFPVNFAKFLRAPFSAPPVNLLHTFRKSFIKNTPGRLLLELLRFHKFLLEIIKLKASCKTY